MKKLAIFAAALMLTLGLAQCKKDQPAPQTTEGETVHITVNVGNNGSKADVNTANGHITFKDGDKLYVGYNGAKVGGELTYSTDDNCFSGELTITKDGDDKPLHFYYLGGGAATQVDATQQYYVDISNQISNYPVISYGTTSPINYTGPGAYTTTLLNKCGLVKFKLSTSTDAAVKVKGLYTKATIDFTNPGVVTPSTTGAITLHSGASNTERWGILLPQTGVSATANIGGCIYELDVPDIADNYYNGNSESGVSIDMSNAIYNPYTTPLTFEAMTAGGATVKLKKGMKVSSLTLQYSTDGSTWTSYTAGSDITLANGDKVMFKGTNTTFANSAASNNYSYFILEGDCYVYGNVMSLISSTDFASTTDFSASSSHNFCLLFRQCTTLYNHPDKCIVLPATTLTDYCYQGMFSGCTNLTATPDLPATMLANRCYYDMFYGCTGLTTAPATLPATTLVFGNYERMFYNCTSLTTAPNLPAPTLMNSCYKQMFYGCSALTSVTCLATDISISSSVEEWLNGVSATGTFYKASSMSGWTVGTNVPAGWTIVDAD